MNWGGELNLCRGTGQSDECHTRDSKTDDSAKPLPLVREQERGPGKDPRPLGDVRAQKPAPPAGFEQKGVLPPDVGSSRLKQ